MGNSHPRLFLTPNRSIILGMIKNLLSNDRAAFFTFAVLAASALSIAFLSQYAYGLQPCELCLYQRVPYAAAILVCILGIAFGRSHSVANRLFLGLTALSFLADAVAAGYHTGVERHWWKSFLEGCSVPPMEGNITDVLAKIAATPAVRCDEIPWTDPLIGLSMANFNLMFALALTAAALYAFKRQA